MSGKGLGYKKEGTRTCPGNIVEESWVSVKEGGTLSRVREGRVLDDVTEGGVLGFAGGNKQS
jgi:hypothetical protein